MLAASFKVAETELLMTKVSEVRVIAT